MHVLFIKKIWFSYLMKPISYFKGYDWKIFNMESKFVKIEKQRNSSMKLFQLFLVGEILVKKIPFLISNLHKPHITH